jgi:Ca2+-binding EF-hand superfamily protein
MAAASETPKFSPDMIASLFDEFDADHDGAINVEEFQIMCSGLGFAFPAEKAKEVRSSARSRCNGLCVDRVGGFCT